MAKMWEGRTDGVTNKIADDFNSSISFDKKMYRQDVCGSIAHASMLCKQNIITAQDGELIIKGLVEILSDIENGTLDFDYTAEDIHMFIESELTKRIGDVGKKLHTARSRNDQVALDLKMYVKDELNKIISLLYDLEEVILNLSENNVDTVMCGYTHLQRAQPISFAQHILAYGEMFKRDISRLKDCTNRLNYSPLGSCALAGTTYDTDRHFVAEKLGFLGVTENSIDGVSDRDYCVEALSSLSIIMMHLSRFCEEIILWSSWEFKYVELDNAFTTGSSIMPQKKNSDMAELIRGKTGRVYGNLMGTLTMLKGLPLAYNKDMQEDKESIFDGLETVINCLNVFNPMLASVKVNKQNMLNAAKTGFINATDLADYLTKKGVPFREAYKIVGKIVGECVEKNCTLEDLTLNDYKAHNELFEDDLYTEIELYNCMAKRTSYGGTGINSIETQLKILKDFIANKDN